MISMAIALDANYPVPNSPHQSVITKNESDRKAFTLGWELAIGILTIEVEKALCAKIGREWTASGISIEALIDELCRKDKE